MTPTLRCAYVGIIGYRAFSTRLSLALSVSKTRYSIYPIRSVGIRVSCFQHEAGARTLRVEDTLPYYPHTQCEGFAVWDYKVNTIITRKAR